MPATPRQPVAVVGVGALLPDAPDAPTFWHNVKSGRYSISEVPPERWEPDLYYDPDPKAPDRSYSKIGGWVRDWSWEPLAWGLPIPPKVSDAMDRTQKWAVACARQALLDYGWPERPLDPRRTAVILGNAMAGDRHYRTATRLHLPELSRELAAGESFAALGDAERRAVREEFEARVRHRWPEINEDTMPGELANIIAGRVANLFDLHGPNFVCDAACASAMAGISAAVAGLDQGDFDAVVTGGVDANMSASTYIKFCKIGALSGTGTRPYGEGADGFVMGEGAALFVLKRLADAERDGDRVYAVLRGVGGSSDGRGKGITAPNPVGQRLAVERAWRQAGLTPADVGMVEGHGTSTKVGDVVEVDSLGEVFGSAGLAPGSVPLGSVKSNIGHLKGAAGAAGLLKAVYALDEKVLPPSLNCTTPNPNLDLSQSPFRLQTALGPWEVEGDRLRRAGVSAFGFGGTNFHLVLEEHAPGRNGEATRGREQVGWEGTPAGAAPLRASAPARGAADDAHDPRFERTPGGVPADRTHVAEPGRPPLRGALLLGAAGEAELAERLRAVLAAAEAGDAPPPAPPEAADLAAPLRLAIDHGDGDELAAKATKALRALEEERTGMWRALRAQGVHLDRGEAPKVAFLYTGQGSQYAGMLQDLAAVEPLVAETFAEADAVMAPIIGRPLTELVFVDPDDADAVAQAERDLRQTEITQPAVLAVDVALTRLLGAYGVHPDMVMGHSLGEYGALVAAGCLPFAQALEAVSARGREMAGVSAGDNGAMAAVFAPMEEIEEGLGEVDGYAVVANLNSSRQAVIGGATEAVEAAAALFRGRGHEVRRLPVSHAFHTEIVAPAAEGLRRMLDRFELRPPRIPLVANVHGGFYPDGGDAVEEMKDLLARQIASPVRFVDGLETLYTAGARAFVEVGPKRALVGFVQDVLGSRDGVRSIYTNHPKNGGVASFNQALCGLYAAGLGSSRPAEPARTSPMPERPSPAPPPAPAHRAAPAAPAAGDDRLLRLGRLFADVLERGSRIWHGADGGEAVPVISGAGLGLPGTERVFDDANLGRLLRGENLIDAVPTRHRNAMVDRNITRVVKDASGSGSFETIDSAADVLKLAARAGAFDLATEFGVPEERVAALDRATRLAVAAGLEALRDAGVPLALRYRRTTKGTWLPERWGLPEALRDDTGVIFASAFPGYDAYTEEMERYHRDRSRRERLADLDDLRARLDPGSGLLAAELDRRIRELRAEIEAHPYRFDRRFLFKVLSMGHSQFAELIGARGPNTQVNAACASTTQAVSLAEEWVRHGRCRRVVVISADDITSEALLPWFGAGFLASGAAATDDVVEEAALPFDRRRHGLLIGMGAAALVVESADATADRGLAPLAEVLESRVANSAFHGSRLDVDHIVGVMERLVADAEARWGLDRHALAAQTVFVSHETYTPARGGSAQAEVEALRRVFGASADRIVIANTKGLTGHAMGTGIEDVVAAKALETGLVPPVANFREVDPELGRLNLSRGGLYPVEFALRLGAGFGSQIAMTLTRRVPTAGARPAPEETGWHHRVVDRTAWEAFLVRVSGHTHPEVEVVDRTLRLRDQGPPEIVPATEERPAAGRAEGAAGAPHGGAPPVAPHRGSAPRPGAGPAATGPTAPPAPGPASAGPGVPRSAEPEPSRTAPATAAGAGSVVPSSPATEPAAPDTTATPPAPPTAPGGPDAVTTRVLEIVAEQTGYPPDMLDLDLDLEADLGIDTVKQAETFAAIRSEWDIERDENLQLRQYPTLGHAVRFVYEKRPDLEPAGDTEPGAVGATPGAPPATAPPATTAGTPSGPGAPAGAGGTPSASPPANAADTADAAATHTPGTADPVTAKVLEIVAEQTGYPPDMLDLDLDLEADLGIDTVKQAETFAAIRAEWDIERDENLQLREYPTLGHAVRFVYEKRPDLEPAGDTAPADVADAADTAATHTPGTADPVTAKVLEIVAEQTGYPPDMLDLDLDLEADLGIDTVKQAETFAAIRAEWNIERDENLQLREYPTLGHAVRFVYEKRPDLEPAGDATPGAAETAGAAGSATTPPAIPTGATPAPDTDAPSGGAATTRPATGAPPTEAAGPETAEAARIPIRVPVPVPRPGLELFKPTGVELGEGSRVVVFPDRGGVGRALVGRLQKRGVEVLAVDGAPAADELTATLEGWLADGPVDGLYWLPALDEEGDPAELSADERTEALRVRARLLYTALRALYEPLAGPGRFLLTATRLGGRHGYDAAGAVAPLGGAVTGLAKTFQRERPDCLVKAVDLPSSRRTASYADLLIAETLTDPGAVEIGRTDDGHRWSVGLVDRPADGPGVELGADTVFLVTGAAGGIVSAIVADLAAASAGRFHLLDLAPEPDPDDAALARDLDLFATDREALKRDIFQRLRDAGERATPAKVERELADLERAAAARSALRAVEAAGGTARWHRVDLTDEPAVRAAVEAVREAEGRVDVLLHAAGLEVSRALPDKEPAEFDRVFGVKAEGWLHLLAALGDAPLGTAVLFGSIAGRFGNAGQADYAAANDLLAKSASAFRRHRPGSRALTVDWTAWGGIGMATRGSIPQVMAAAGIDMLPPELGVPFVRRQLTAGRQGEVVAALRLGAMTARRDATGGLDLAPDAALPAAATAAGPMVGRVAGLAADGTLVVETELDPAAQPFLDDHRIDGTPVLPGVMGIEAFAEAAPLPFPDLRVTAVEEVEFLAPFKLYRDEPRTARIEVRYEAAGDGDDGGTLVVAHCRLVGHRALPGSEEPRETVHFTARVLLAPEAAGGTDPEPVDLDAEDLRPPGDAGASVNAEDVYRLYFHGPAYQVLDRAWRADGAVVGHLSPALPPNHRPEDLPTRIEPRWIELAFQTAGLWQMGHGGSLGLPRRVERLRVPAATVQGEVLAVVKPRRDGEDGYDARLVDPSGRVLLELTGYHTVELPGGVDPDRLAPLTGALGDGD